MRYSNFMPQVTLAQSFIAQGLIKDPLFVEAAGLQKSLMAQTGSSLKDAERALAAAGGVVARATEIYRATKSPSAK